MTLKKCSYWVILVVSILQFTCALSDGDVQVPTLPKEDLETSESQKMYGPSYGIYYGQNRNSRSSSNRHPYYEHDLMSSGNQNMDRYQNYRPREGRLPAEPKAQPSHYTSSNSQQHYKSSAPVQSYQYSPYSPVGPAPMQNYQSSTPVQNHQSSPGSPGSKQNDQSSSPTLNNQSSPGSPGTKQNHPSSSTSSAPMQNNYQSAPVSSAPPQNYQTPSTQNYPSSPTLSVPMQNNYQSTHVSSTPMQNYQTPSTQNYPSIPQPAYQATNAQTPIYPSVQASQTYAQGPSAYFPQPQTYNGPPIPVPMKMIVHSYPQPQNYNENQDQQSYQASAQQTYNPPAQQSYSPPQQSNSYYNAVPKTQSSASVPLPMKLIVHSYPKAQNYNIQQQSQTYQTAGTNNAPTTYYETASVQAQMAPQSTYQQSPASEYSSSSQASSYGAGPSTSTSYTFGSSSSSGASEYGDSSSQIQIIRHHQEITPGSSHHFDYETANGIKHKETTFLSQDDYALTKEGAFSYTSPEGQPISITYTADKTGFKAQGEHLPTPPPIPEEIRASISNSYGGQSYGSSISSGY